MEFKKLQEHYLKHDLINRETVVYSSDLEIWRAFKKGNESAFIHIYESNLKSLLNYGLNFMGNREVVKDCIQDMFIEIREKRRSISETDSIKPYLFKILRRKINRYISKYAKLQEVDILPAHEKFQISLSHEQFMIEQQINASQMKLLKEAILKLTPKEREAIFHFYYEHHSYQEIAEIMGYSNVKTARSLVYKAISSLKNILEPFTFNLFSMFL
jgi:RNA polymerase sigma factor (sigma-70 family)